MIRVSVCVRARVCVTEVYVLLPCTSSCVCASVGCSCVSCDRSSVVNVNARQSFVEDRRPLQVADRYHERRTK